MKGIYLGAYKAFHPGYDIVYQDINGKRDIPGDMLDIDLSNYDFIIATPPYNYYSRCNHKPTTYALETAHLLPDIIKKLELTGKPFIVENVRSSKKFNELGLLNRKNTYVYFIGRHTYWSSIPFYTWVNQDIEYKPDNTLIDNKNDQGGLNVFNVIESWLKEVHKNLTL